MADVGTQPMRPVSAGERQIQELSSAGFTADEINQHVFEERDRLSQAGFTPKEIDDYYGVPTPDPTPLDNYFRNNFARIPVEKKHKLAESWQEALAAGWGMSVVGLGINQAAPETVLPETASIGHKILAAGAQVVGDIPAMILGHMAGQPVGAAVGSAFGPKGTLIGGVIGGGVGANGLPQAIREMLLMYYNRGDIKDFDEFLSLAQQAFLRTGEQMLIGGVAAPLGFGAQAAVTRATAKPVAGGMANVLTQAATMATLGPTLEGRIPTADDFIIAGALGLGAFGAGRVVNGIYRPAPPAEHVTHNLQELYRQHGVHPRDAIEAARNDPVLLDELRSQDATGQPVFDRLRLLGPPEPEPYEVAKVVEAEPPGPPRPPEPPAPEPPPSWREDPDFRRDYFRTRIADEVRQDSLSDPKKLYRQFVSELGPARDIDAKLIELGHDQSTNLGATDMFRNTYGSNARLSYFVRYGTLRLRVDERGQPSYEHAHDYSYDSAVRLLRERGGNIEDWLHYRLSQRALDKAAQGIDTGLDLEVARRTVDHGRRIYEEPTREVNRVFDAVLEMAIQTGLYNRERVQAMKDLNPSYISMRRVGGDDAGMPGGAGRTFRARDPLRRMEGSDRQIANPILADLDNMLQIIKASDRNLATQFIVNAATSRGYADVLGVRQVEPPSDFRATIARPGSDVFEPYLAEDVARMSVALEPFLAMRAQRQGRLKPNQFIYFRRGVPEVWEAADPDLAALIRGADSPGEANLLDRTMTAFGSLQRAGITLAWDYPYKQLMKDQINMYVVDPSHPPPFVTAARGVIDSFGFSEIFKKWVANGGAGAALVDMDINYLSRNFSQVMRETDSYSTLWNYVRHPLEAAQLLSERVDAQTRLGIFKRDLAADRNELKAAMHSREAVLDFHERGTLPFMQMWTRWTPFLRANLLGLAQLGRAVKNNPGQTLFYSTFGIAAPTIALYMLNYAQDEGWFGEMPENRKYRNLPRWERDTAFITPDVFGVRLKLAMPFELGFVFGGFINRALDGMLAADPKAFDGVVRATLNAFMPGLMPAAVTPIMEHATGWKLAFNRPLIPSSVANNSPDMQYMPETTETAKKLSLVLGRHGLGHYTAYFGFKPEMSPITIENYVRQWTGTIGYDTMRILNKPFSGRDKPWEIADLPLLGSFFVRNPGVSAEPIHQFYEEAKRVREALADKRTALQRTLMGMDTGGELERALDDQTARIDHFSKALQLMRFSIEAAYHDKDMKPAEKRQLAERLASDMILTAKAGSEILREVRASVAEKPYEPKMDDVKYNMLTDFVSRIWGSSTPNRQTEIKAAAMDNYPTSEDVAFAKENGFYNDMFEPWTTGQIARVLNRSAVGMSLSEATDIRNSKLIKGNPELAEVYAKGLLASNRIPLAKIGFDPDRINIEPNLKQSNFGGLYNVTKDQMFAVAASASSVVHESIHRGIELLTRQNPEAAELVKKLPSEEYVVRYLMATQAGNPEKGKGAAGDAQIANAEYVFGKSIQSSEYRATLDRLTVLAQDWLAKNRPGGYRH